MRLGLIAMNYNSIRASVDSASLLRLRLGCLADDMRVSARQGVTVARLSPMTVRTEYVHSVPNASN